MTRVRLMCRVLPLLLAGCASDADQVCENIGLCADQDDPTIALCKAQAAELGDESFDAGCGPAYDSYYSCANGAYTCTGNTPWFPGCETALGTLDSCLEVAQTSTSCGELARALAAC